MTSGSTPPWPSASQQVHEILKRHIIRYEVEHRVMFGAPCYFIKGNMFAGVLSDYIFLRLSPQDRKEVLDAGIGKEFIPRPGRTMKEYCTLSGPIINDEGTLSALLNKSYAYVMSLGPKKRAKGSKKKKLD